MNPSTREQFPHSRMDILRPRLCRRGTLFCRWRPFAWGQLGGRSYPKFIIFGPFFGLLLGAARRGQRCPCIQGTILMAEVLLRGSSYWSGQLAWFIRSWRRLSNPCCQHYPELSARPLRARDSLDHGKSLRNCDLRRSLWQVPCLCSVRSNYICLL